MLILGRKHKQAILIGENIRVEIFIHKKPGMNPQIKVGIDAPEDVRITREEIAPRYINENNDKGEQNEF